MEHIYTSLRLSFILYISLCRVGANMFNSVCSRKFIFVKMWRKQHFYLFAKRKILRNFRENIFVSSLLSCIILVSESNLLDFTQTKLQTYLNSTADSFFVFILDEFSSQKLLQRKATWPQQLTHAQYSSTAAIVEATWRKGPADMRPL